MIDCLVVNLEPTPLQIPAGTKLASFDVMEGPVAVSELVRAVVTLKDSTEIVKVGDELDEDQLRDLQVLLDANLDVFSINNQLGESRLIEHEIVLEEGAKPAMEPLRRRPQLHKEEAARQVAEMLEAGIVEPSSSPWASAYVIVKKKTGDYRLCVDFRRLNKFTKKNSFPPPNIEDCLESLSCLELSSRLSVMSQIM